MRLFFLLSSYSLSYCINESAYFTEISHLIRLAQHGYMFGHGISTSLLIYLFPTSVFGAGCFSFFQIAPFPDLCLLPVQGNRHPLSQNNHVFMANMQTEIY